MQTASILAFLNYKQRWIVSTSDLIVFLYVDSTLLWMA